MPSFLLYYYSVYLSGGRKVSNVLRVGANTMFCGRRGKLCLIIYGIPLHKYSMKVSAGRVVPTVSLTCLRAAIFFFSVALASAFEPGLSSCAFGWALPLALELGRGSFCWIST